MMKKILIYGLLGCLPIMVGAADPAEMRQAEKQLDAAADKLARQQTENRELEKQIQVIHNTQQYLLTGKKPAATPETGNAIAVETFDGSTPLTKFWSKVPAWADYDNGALLINVTDSQAQTNTRIYFPLPASVIAGKKLKVSVKFKAENITKPPQHYLGSQFYLSCNRGGGKDFGKGITNSFGSWDWNAASFEVDVPFGIADANIIMGMQGVTGKIWFKNLKVEIIEGSK